jgi:hypothetical protein
MAKSSVSKKKKKKMATDNDKEAICVRMKAELYRCVKEDADNGERTPPAQIRLILKKHYGLNDED